MTSDIGGKWSEKKQSNTYTMYFSISNGNGTEWSPIRSVIIQVITKSEDQQESDLFITSWFKLQLQMWLVDSNYNFECDWLIELSDNIITVRKQAVR